MSANQETRHSIIQVIGAIPKGKVCTYGRIAELAGLPRHARFVGTILKQLPNDSRIPWHRVINSQGRISFPEGTDKWQLQKQKQEREGITFVGDQVPLKQFLW
ncbi:MAG: cysteine methyltransferase [Pseudomonadales bacterium]|nr:cysteine methyltransferase [Pseudomonadales bacterium]